MGFGLLPYFLGGLKMAKKKKTKKDKAKETKTTTTKKNTKTTKKETKEKKQETKEKNEFEPQVPLKDIIGKYLHLNTEAGSFVYKKDSLYLNSLANPPIMFVKITEDMDIKTIEGALMSNRLYLSDKDGEINMTGEFYKDHRDAKIHEWDDYRSPKRDPREMNLRHLTTDRSDYNVFRDVVRTSEKEVLVLLKDMLERIEDRTTVQENKLGLVKELLNK